MSSFPPTSITSSSGVPPLRPISSHLKGSSASSARASASLTTRREKSCPPDDLLHPFGDRSQVLGSEGFGRIEVVVETIFDGWPNTELRSWKQVLNRLGEHVSSGVAKDGPALVGINQDGFDEISVGNDRREVA